MIRQNKPLKFKIGVIDCIITVAQRANRKLLKTKIYPRVNITILTGNKECYISAIIILAQCQNSFLVVFPRRTVAAATRVISAK